ncbi:beta-fructofuranosidase [Haloferax gibbonsii ATCC 33959]|uniref:beta-fructofuranosidase n=1 Tax=Haloferax gibbonsii (strain ATCC 33959 / DSM 4427 / JCM 8863 / NBRC 102184 / NCIMB 2188 / Ma 2.38) TaxID=1227459 RepID=M0GXR8_HALGM|nr:glycoside hydrolase family 32 protein [Haloferax gibbonsii]ELZ76307.1 beta-fructofuranosidase [Haloferax gibbonsii ATCC 33959]
MDDNRTSSHTVGFLTIGERTAEQQYAQTFLDSFTTVEPVAFGSIESKEDIAKYDLLWWHRDAPISEETLPEDALSALTAYVEGGGGLYLGLYALNAVDRLGIDPHPPDHVEATYVPNHTFGQQPAGFLIKTRFEESSVFAEFSGRRVHTQRSRKQSAPRLVYRDRVPRNGDVLASSVVGEQDRPAENSIIAWSPGRGRVFGVGQHLVFSELSEPYEDTVKTLVSGLVSHLGNSEAEKFSGRPKTPDELAEIRTELDGDAHRPTYHFAPPANWMNDPNGIVEYDGTYHLFYQYNPAGPYHGSIHWGHATSDDLVYWEDRPVALTPDLDGPDKDGCWSGCTVLDDGQPTFVYTGGSGGDQTPCLARAIDDSLDEWEKHPGNPVIEDIPEELGILSNDQWNAEFRDHDVWREDGTWYHLIGTGLEDGGGAAILYTSDTLTEWELVGPLLVGDRHEDGPLWECPELLDFGESQVLQVSNYDKVVYFVGTFDGTSFDRRADGTVDHGNYYAAQSVPHGEDQYLSWGWIREDRDGAAQWDAGWSGVMSLPRVLSLDEDDTLRVRPTPEVEALRGHHQSLPKQTLSPEDSVFPETSGSALEIQVTFELGDAEAFELVVGESPDGAERTPVRYSCENELVVDRSASSESKAPSSNSQRIPSISTDDGLVTLHVFVDGSVVELFANERESLSSRIYPTREDSTGVSLNAVGGDVAIHNVDIWELDPAFSPDDGKLAYQQASPTNSGMD